MASVHSGGAALQPVPLSENLGQLASLLKHESVAQHEEFSKKNVASLTQLVNFLRAYCTSLHKEQPLKAQRHALEFVLPCASSPVAYDRPTRT
jgi:hypothetical protein